MHNPKLLLVSMFMISKLSILISKSDKKTFYNNNTPYVHDEFIPIILVKMSESVEYF